MMSKVENKVLQEMFLALFIVLLAVRIVVLHAANQIQMELMETLLRLPLSTAGGPSMTIKWF